MQSIARCDKKALTAALPNFEGVVGIEDYLLLNPIAVGVLDKEATTTSANNLARLVRELGQVRLALPWHLQ